MTKLTLALTINDSHDYA